MRLPILAAILLSAPAIAQTPPAKPVKPAKGSPEEVVCRREPETGSLISARRTCMTRAQWAAQSEVAQSQAYAMEDRGRVTGCAQQNGC